LKFLSLILFIIPSGMIKIRVHPCYPWFR